MYKCMRCRHDLIISGNFMVSDLNEEVNEDEDSIVTNMVCPYCGATYEVYDTPESEKENYPYWRN